jgi:hypothetical protein
LFIPSCEVNAVDQLRGTETETRLVRGLEEWRASPYDKIVVMGGIYLPPTVQRTASAFLMRDWLIERGVPIHDIIPEDSSRDTFENIDFALAIIEADIDTDITVVSEWQHVLRFWVTMTKDYLIVPRLIGVWKDKGVLEILKEVGFLTVHILSFRGYDPLSWWGRRGRTYST